MPEYLSLVSHPLCFSIFFVIHTSHQSSNLYGNNIVCNYHTPYAFHFYSHSHFVSIHIIRWYNIVSNGIHSVLPYNLTTKTHQNSKIPIKASVNLLGTKNPPCRIISFTWLSLAHRPYGILFSVSQHFLLPVYHLPPSTHKCYQEHSC